MLLSAVLIWTSTWPSILWSWWVQTLRTLSVLSLLKAAMERSTLTTTGEDPNRGCVPGTGIWMSYLPPKDRAALLVSQGRTVMKVFVLPISDLSLVAKPSWLPRAVWLGWPLGETLGVGVGWFCWTALWGSWLLKVSLTFYAVFI